MHELSIAVSIVDAACDELSKLGRVQVRAIHLRLGILSGVVKEALIFSFDAAAAGTAIEGARLEIEDVAASVWCGPCATERTLAAVSRRCPVCQALTPELTRGDEMEIVGLEVVDS